MLKCMNLANVLNRDFAARGDGLGRHELLDAVGTLIKGGENFLEI